MLRLIIGILCLFTISNGFANKTESYCRYYPHWSDCKSNQALKQIEVFIQRYKGLEKRYAVAFDWDGTLYDERIPVVSGKQTQYRSGQSVWHQWAAQQLLRADKRNDFLFPSFRQIDRAGKVDYVAWSHAIREYDDFLEGSFKTEANDNENQLDFVKVPADAYDKFMQIVTFEAGMTPLEMMHGVHRYLANYPSKRYAIYKTLDVMARLQQAGFQVLVITGSNPYFIAQVLTDKQNGIASLGYKPLFPSCQRFMWHMNQNKRSTANDFFAACPILGNAAVWRGGATRFARQYDDRNFVEVNQPIRLIVDGYGKFIAAKHWVTNSHRPIVLYAGNSDGDMSLMRRVLNNIFKVPHGTFGVFVQPNAHGGHRLTQLYLRQCQAGQCLLIK